MYTVENRVDIVPFLENRKIKKLPMEEAKFPSAWGCFRHNKKAIGSVKEGYF